MALTTKYSPLAGRSASTLPEHRLSVLLTPPPSSGTRRLLEQVKRHLVAGLFDHQKDSDTERLLQDINWALTQPAPPAAAPARPALSLGDVLPRRRFAVRRTQTLFRDRRAA